MPIRDKAKKAAHQREWAKGRRDRAIALLGGKCAVCGVTENLEIDHVVPADKSFGLGRVGSKAWSEIELELVKCQALCRTHHLEKTKRERVPLSSEKASEMGKRGGATMKGRKFSETHRARLSEAASRWWASKKSVGE